MAETPDSPLNAPPAARVLAHFWMILGVIVIAFPISYYVFIASTQPTQTILRPPCR